MHANTNEFISFDSTSNTIPRGCITIAEILSWARSRLSKSGIESPQLDAEVLLAYVLDCERVDLYTKYDQPVPDYHKKCFKKLIQQRLQRVPVNYLTGRCEFMSLEFEVNRDVLIPRPETEFIVETALEKVEAIASSEMPEHNIFIGEIGTGSGNIAVAIAVYCKKSIVYACDISQAALDVARRNAQKHGVNDRVIFLKGDLFDAFSDVNFSTKLDIVVSNPPYVSESEWQKTAPEIRDYEPPYALIAGRDGLEYLRRIVIQASPFIKVGGWLILEIGAGQRNDVAQLIDEQQVFNGIKVIKDYNGIERIITAQKYL